MRTTSELADTAAHDSDQSRKRRRTYPPISLLDPLPQPNAQYERRPLNYEAKVDIEHTLAFASRHKRLRLRDIELTDLPKYDDTSHYKIPEKEEQRLWRIEIERLVGAASSHEHILFDSNGKLGATNAAGFRDIEAISDQIACNIYIIHHDNGLLDAKDKHDRSEKRFFSTAKRSLETRLSESVEYEDDNFKRAKPRILDAHNREIYFAYVDFVTALLARYLYRCATAEGWHDICFSTLAKWATKLKILEKDPIAYASLSLEAADDLDDEKEQVDYLGFLDGKSPFSRKEEKFNPSEMYHFEESTFREVLIFMFIHLLRAPWGDSGEKAEFEITTRVYRSGLGESHTAINSDKDAEFFAANDRRQMRYVRAGLDILLANARQVQIKGAGRVAQDDASDPVFLTWSWNVADITLRPPSLRHPANGALELTTMDDVVSIVTAQALSGVDISVEAYGMVFLMRHHIPLFHEGHNLAEFVDEDLVAHVNVYNKSFADSRDRRIVGADFKSLTEATVFATRIVPGSDLVNAHEPNSVLARSNHFWNRLWPPQPEEDVLRASMNRTDSWTFDEKSVIVPCKAYVRTLLALAAFIVAGGLAIPFSSRVRLEGVDPFNIASFTWIAVIFMLLLAQSRYVPAWAWHDFLHSRIVCRNVTELAHVSKLDPQLVLHKLLITEKSTNLHTRGPYNSMFRRTAEDGYVR